MKISKLLKNQDGAAAVESAIVIPLLVLIAFGICEFGLLCYNKQVITNACRESARAGIVRDSTNPILDDELKKIVKDYCNQRLIDFGGTDLTDADIELNPTPDTARMAAYFGSDFSVKVTYNYRFAVPSLFGLGTTTSISHLALMKMERIPG